MPSRITLTRFTAPHGHVLSFTLEEGTLEVASCPRLELLLPKDPSALDGIDFSRDRSKELEKAEK